MIVCLAPELFRHAHSVMLQNPCMYGLHTSDQSPASILPCSVPQVLDSWPSWLFLPFIVFFTLSLYLLFSHSVISNFVTPWTAACQASLFFTISQSLLKLMPIESVMLCNHPFVIPFSSCLQPFPASGSFLSQLFTSGGQSAGASYSTLFP